VGGVGGCPPGACGRTCVVAAGEVGGCPPGACGRTCVGAAAAIPAAAVPGPAEAPGLPPASAPGVGRCCTGVPACCPAVALGRVWVGDAFTPPGVVGGGWVGATRGCCAGGAATLPSGRSAPLPNPSRVQRDSLGAGGGGGSQTGTALGAGRAPGAAGAGGRGCV
jgi:hypothetical protein